MGEGVVTVVLGHERQRKQLENLAEHGKVPPSLIFSGPAGVGKFAAARELAQTILCRGDNGTYGGCGTCQSCELFSRNAHPDFRALDCSDKDISGVEGIRTLLNQLSYKSYLGGNRVCVFRDAEQLSAASANVLLKNFEEPRDGQHFILVASTTSRLPVPLVSRCQLFHFGVLDRETLLRVLQPAIRESVEASPILYDTLLTGGTVEGLSEVGELAEQLEDLARRLEALAAGQTESISEFVSSFGADRELVRKRLANLRLLVRRKMLNAPSALEKRHYSFVLQNTLTAEYAISERNLSPATVLVNLLLTVPFTSTEPDDTLLSDLIL